LIAKGAGPDYKTSAEIVVRKTVVNPPPPLSGDSEAIKALIDRFGTAYVDCAYGDCGDLNGLWPSLTPGQRKAITDTGGKLKHLRVKETCPGSPGINGETAEWNCTETTTYDGPTKRTQIAFHFKKTSGNWYVDSHSPR
jgi:hypothetical protein